MFRYSALRQLFLARLREFYREPMVIFWVYGFPIFLAVALGWAFSAGLPGVGSAPSLGERYIDFLIPGLMGFNMLTGGLWGVGYVIVDLRVRKLLKRFLATPMHPSDFLLAIVGSRLLFLIPEMMVLLLVGYLGFGTPVRGNFFTLALVVLLGGAAFCGIGLLLACRTEKAETVSGLINLLALPSWMFSGTFFSVERFPVYMRPLVLISPLTHVNDALRAVMLEGASLADVAGNLLVLAAWTVASFVVALKLFRWH